MKGLFDPQRGHDHRLRSTALEADKVGSSSLDRVGDREAEGESCSEDRCICQMSDFAVTDVEMATEPIFQNLGLKT